MLPLPLPSVPLWCYTEFSFTCLSLCHTLQIIIKEVTIRGESEGWCSRRNFRAAKIDFSCLSGITHSPVARRMVFQQLPSWSRAVVTHPGTWWRPVCWVWGHVGSWMEALRYHRKWLPQTLWWRLSVWLLVRFVGTEQANGCSASLQSDSGWNLSPSRKNKVSSFEGSCLGLFKSFATQSFHLALMACDKKNGPFSTRMRNNELPAW